MKFSIPNIFVRLEGLVVLAVATTLYFWLQGSTTAYFILLLLPDVGMLGYIKNKSIGALIYNVSHSYILPILFLMLALMWNITVLIPYLLIWFAHIGMDRMIGYGLKYSTGFFHTHMHKI